MSRQVEMLGKYLQRAFCEHWVESGTPVLSSMPVNSTDGYIKIIKHELRWHIFGVNHNVMKPGEYVINTRL
jgi:hypothetical protein